MAPLVGTVPLVVRLIVTAGRHVGRQFAFSDHRTFLVGRSHDAHLRFPDDDPYISRLHFLLEVNPPQVRLVDLGSTNGTSVNGKRVSECSLGDGDTIEAGETRISVFVGRSPDATRVASDDEAGDPLVTRVAATSKSPLPLPAEPQTASEGTSARAVEQASDHDRDLEQFVGQEVPTGPPRTIGDYSIVRELGRGSFGVVYLASRTNRLFALKLLRVEVAVDERQRLRFLREIEILKRLRHRAVVRFIEAGDDRNGLFLVTEYVKGENLESILHRVGPLRRRSAVRIVRHVLHGLSDAHAKGFLHRDIKPANIIVNPRQVKLADFGLAASFQATMLSGCTLSGESGGSIGYMPPEQLLEFHQSKPTNDIYSVGATLYRLLSGQLPYDFPELFHSRVRVLLQHDPVPLRERVPKLPKELCEIVDRCLRRKPSERWPTAEALRDALTPYSLENPGDEVSSPPRVSTSAKRPSDHAQTSSREIRRHVPAGGHVPGDGRILWRVTHRDGSVPSETPLRGMAVATPEGTIAVALRDELLFVSSDGIVLSRFRCAARIVGWPLVLHDGTAVVHASDGQLHAVTAAGDPAWAVHVGEPLGGATPLKDADERIWICSCDGGLLRVRDHGQLDRRRFYRSMRRLDSVGLIEGDTLWIGGDDARVHAIDLSGSKGADRWTEDCHGRCDWYVTGAILRRSPDEIVARCGAGLLHAFAPDGSPTWQWPVPGTVLGDAAVGPDGLMFQGYHRQSEGKQEGGILCIDAERGRSRWDHGFDAGVESTPVVSPTGCLFVGDNAGQIHAVDEQGDVAWRVELEAPVRSRLSMLPDQNVLLVIADDASLTAIRVDE